MDKTLLMCIAIAEEGLVVVMVDQTIEQLERRTLDPLVTLVLFCVWSRHFGEKDRQNSRRKSSRGET